MVTCLHIFSSACERFKLRICALYKYGVLKRQCLLQDLLRAREGRIEVGIWKNGVVGTSVKKEEHGTL